MFKYKIINTIFDKRFGILFLTVIANAEYVSIVMTNRYIDTAVTSSEITPNPKMLKLR
ncbi:MAG: hypothetical protein J7L22_06990 [Candidatus Marinimicrobia bacterium]|nr:hypothetical protein [Candidatus Neomarinimicrobiota bacterium]